MDQHDYLPSIATQRVMKIKLGLVFVLGSLLLQSTIGNASPTEIQNTFTLDLSPLALSAHNPIGGGLGVSYNRYHPELKTYYSLTFDTFLPYTPNNSRTDSMLSLGFFTEITKAFSVGARVGMLLNAPGGLSGFGAIALRLPALYPDDKKFLSFFFEEIDLGITGAASQYACFRLGMLLF